MSSINSEIFKAYDIRGIYGENLFDETAYAIGRAFVKFLNKERPIILVSRDARLSSPALAENLIKGLLDAGADVVDAGITTTPMHYFILNIERFDGGIMVTGSHNPKEQNGFKLNLAGAAPIGEGFGMEEFKKIALTYDFIEKEKGNLEEKMVRQARREDYSKQYIDFLSNQLKPNNLKIIIDASNGVVGLFLPKILESVGINYKRIFFEPDGNFPNHGPNPILDENIKTLKNEILKERADLGVIFDADGDRVIFLDEKGERIPADIVAAVIAQEYLKDNKGGKIFYDIRSSRIVREEIGKSGGEAVCLRIGHTFFKRAMKEQNGIFGGELSGHYYFKDFFNCDSGIFAMIKFFDVLNARKNGRPLSEFVGQFLKYSKTPEINFFVKDKLVKIKEVENFYKNQAKNISQIDGITVEFNNWWFNLRSSNTEPVLRLNLEADIKELMTEKLKEISGLIDKS